MPASIWLSSIARKCVAIRLMTSAASPGDRMPAAQLSKTAPDAATASVADSILGKSNATARSRRGGNRRSKQSRSAGIFPSSAIATTFRVSASASPSSRASIASVALFRAPFGRPLGLPLWPGSNGRPRDFATWAEAFELWMNEGSNVMPSVKNNTRTNKGVVEKHQGGRYIFL